MPNYTTLSPRPSDRLTTSSSASPAHPVSSRRKSPYTSIHTHSGPTHPSAPRNARFVCGNATRDHMLTMAALFERVATYSSNNQLDSQLIPPTHCDTWSYIYNCKFNSPEKFKVKETAQPPSTSAPSPGFSPPRPILEQSTRQTDSSPIAVHA